MITEYVRKLTWSGLIGDRSWETQWLPSYIKVVFAVTAAFGVVLTELLHSGGGVLAEASSYLVYSGGIVGSGYGLVAVAQRVDDAKENWPLYAFLVVPPIIFVILALVIFDAVH